MSDAGRDITNHFCPTCGSTLWWTLELKPDLIGVAVGTVDQPLPRPVRAVWAEAAHDWVAYPDDFTVFPKGSTGT
ncbi:MAG: hypothetical protein HKO95_00500 [Rhodobacteraceae bacterium]|nr:GFA family protein [Alphaproteobacteria bacterium]MBT8475414.1 GFA family protein [Alphaproteobacteria bacterium]NNF70790.1 hypothetical protein [Paracoccaceae bacterium]NNK65195.1 hypothetical protein [Paracoccaceae bacterium]